MRPFPLRRSLLLAALLVLGSLPLPREGRAQKAAAAYVDLGEYVARVWTVDDGLPVTSVYALAQTRDGYLWLGTEGGLVRFDGVRFTAFTRAGTGGGLRSDFVTVLHEDRAGALWVGTRDGGLSRYAEGRFEAFPPSQGLADPHVTALLEERSGRLWIGTNGGLQQRVGERFVPVDGGLPHGHVSALHQDASGVVWVGLNPGLARCDASARPSCAVVPGFEETRVRAFAEDRGGALWLAGSAGLVRLAGDSLALFGTRQGLSHGDVSAVYEDRSGRLWIGTNAPRLDRYDGTRFSSFPAAGAETGRALAYVEDREGSLWVGTLGYGLYQLRPKLVTHLTTREGLGRNLVRPVLEDARGDLWVGTTGGLLHRIREGRVRAYSARDGLPASDLQALAEDRTGALWAGAGYAGVLRLEGDRWVSPPPFERWLWVRALLADRRNRLWVGTDGQGLMRWDGRALDRFDAPGTLPSRTVRAVAEDPAGTLWFGTAAGLVRFERDRFATFAAAEGLADSSVFSLLPDGDAADPVLWIGTGGGGLSRFRQGRLATYRLDPALCGDVAVLLDDGRGHLWTTCRAGHVRIRKADLHAALDDERAAVHPTVFGRESGFAGEGNGGFQPAGWRRRDGTLAFATTHGVALIDPARAEAASVPPPVVIEQVWVDDAPHPPGRALRLGPGRHRLAVDYTGLSFVAPARVRFRYRLEGLDREGWTEAGPRRTAYFDNLPPGRYTFRVAAAGADGVWNETGAGLAFTIARPFHSTPPFLALLALALGLLGTGAYRLRVRRLHLRERELRALVEGRTRDLRAEKERAERALHEAERERERAEAARRTIEEQARALTALDRAKTRFFTNLSHEFRTPLTLILGALEQLLAREAVQRDEAVGHPLRTAQLHAHALRDLINQLLDLSRLDAGRMPLRAARADLVPVLRRVVGSFAPLAERNRIDLQFRSEPASLELYFDAEKLTRVVANLLANAFKFTPEGGRIAVTARAPEADGGPAAVVVRDNGAGIPPEALPHLFERFFQASDPGGARAGTGIGLSLARELVELHGGRITVASEPGFGSVFTVLLPVGAGHLAPGQICAPAPDAPVADLLPLDAPPAPPEPAADDGDAGRPRVLVVEDNPAMRAFLVTSLRDGFRVRTARDGWEALSLSATLRPDLILSDVMMPGLDGFGLCHALRQDERLRDIPVILLSARAGEESEVAGLETGADDYITKPFSAKVLVTRIHALIQQRRQLRDRFSRQVTLGPTRIVVSSRDEAFLERARTVVEAQMHHASFGPAELADELGVSPRQLQRRLRAVAAQSPGEFVRQMRLERAAQLLRQRAGSVSEIAYAVGFSSVPHFSRAFHRRFGAPPSGYARG